MASTRWVSTPPARCLRELRRRAARADLAAPVCRMDVRALGFRRGFDVILCPYSLVTYLTADGDLTRMLHEVREVLRPDGLIVVDAFVPRPIDEHAEFRPDYRRPFGEHLLARSKRIASLDRGHQSDRASLPGNHGDERGARASRHRRGHTAVSTGGVARPARGCRIRNRSNLVELRAA